MKRRQTVQKEKERNVPKRVDRFNRIELWFCYRAMNCGAIAAVTNIELNRTVKVFAFPVR